MSVPGRCPCLLAPLLLLLSSWSKPALAAKPAHECIAAHADGQVAQAGGKLRSARESFLACSDERCPLIIRKECLELGQKVAVALPSVVFSAADEAGHDQRGARAHLEDGTEALLDGRAIDLDPGAHEVSVRLADGRTSRVPFTLLEGEKLRRVSARFADLPPVRPSAGPTPIAYLLGGVGVVALGSFLYFAVDGKNEEECKPHCTRAERNRVRLDYLIADISLGVSVASLGVGTYLYFQSSGAPARNPAPAASARTFTLGAHARF